MGALAAGVAVFGRSEREIGERGIIAYLEGYRSRLNFQSGTLNSYRYAEFINYRLPAGSKVTTSMISRVI